MEFFEMMDTFMTEVAEWMEYEADMETDPFRKEA